MSEKTTHISKWCIGLISMLGGRLASSKEEIHSLMPWDANLSNACNGNWGNYVAVESVHLNADKPTCISCQALLENALKPKAKPGDIHIAPDHHLSFCGSCTCTEEGMKMAPDAEVKAFVNAGKPASGPRGTITCGACIAVVEDTRVLMNKHLSSPMAKVVAEVAEAGAFKRLDRRSRS